MKFIVTVIISFYFNELGFNKNHQVSHSVSKIHLLLLIPKFLLTNQRHLKDSRTNKSIFQWAEEGSSQDHPSQKVTEIPQTPSAFHLRHRLSLWVWAQSRNLKQLSSHCHLKWGLREAGKETESNPPSFPISSPPILPSRACTSLMENFSSSDLNGGVLIWSWGCPARQGFCLVWLQMNTKSYALMQILIWFSF